jgi:adenine-specific DNA methylase
LHFFLIQKLNTKTLKSTSGERERERERERKRDPGREFLARSGERNSISGEIRHKEIPSREIFWRERDFVEREIFSDEIRQGIRLEKDGRGRGRGPV